MASLQQELSIFLTTNIATDQDLNSDQVKSLLDLRRQEQVTLDAEVKEYTFFLYLKHIFTHLVTFSLIL